ncbi:NRT1/ PTR family 8.3-like protein [Tanacetum coccineum]
MSTMFVEQGMAMDTTIGSFTLPADTLSNFDVINVIFWVPVYDKLIVPMARKFTEIDTRGVEEKEFQEQREAEKEIGLDHGCLLLPITTNLSIALSYTTQLLYKISWEHNCGSSGWSKSCGHCQAFLSVQAEAMPEDHQQRTVSANIMIFNLYDLFISISIRIVALCAIYCECGYIVRICVSYCKPIIATSHIASNLIGSRGEVEKEIGLDYGCLLLPRTTNVSIAAAGERNCGSSGWSKACGQGQAFLSVQAGSNCNRSCYVDLELAIQR